MSQNTTTRKSAMVDAMTKSLGIISSACKTVGIDRNTHYRWMAEDEEYAGRIKDISEGCVDFAESSLLKQIKEGNTTATIFFLKTKGRSRGYIEKQEIEHIGSVPVHPSDLTEEQRKARLEELKAKLAIKS